MVTAAEQAALAKDKPLFLVRNILKEINSARPDGPEWRDGATGNYGAGTDVTAPGFDAIRAQDGRPNLRTKPVNTGLSAYTIIFDMTPSPDGVDNELDALVIGNHNFGDLERSSTITITVEFAAGSTFAGATAIASFVNPTNNFRLASFNLNAFTRYTATRFVRITIVSDTALLTTPAFGELFMGRRRQMGHKADRGFTEFSYITGKETLNLAIGNSVDFVNFKGKAVLPRVWRPQDGVDDTGLDDALTMKEIVNEIDGTFIYAENPSTGLQKYLFCKIDGNLDLIKNAINYFNATPLVLREQGPFLIKEQGVS